MQHIKLAIHDLLQNSIHSNTSFHSTPANWLLHIMADPEKRIGQVEIEPVAKDVVFGQVVELVGPILENKLMGGR